MRVLFFGTYDAARQPRVRVLREGFAALGDEIYECNVPLALDNAMRVQMLKEPWRVPQLAVRLASAWWRLVGRSRAIPDPDVVVVGYLGHFDVHLARRLYPAVPLVLDHMISARDTALDRGIDAAMLLRVLDRVDRWAVRACDVPLLDTEEHVRLLPAAARLRALVVPVGAAAHWYRQPRGPSKGALRVIFYGSFAPLQGARTIGEAIGLLAGDPGVQFTVAGQGQDYPSIRAAAEESPHVRWLGWIDPTELPSIVAEHDVCLGIFGSTAKAYRVVPHKVFEGAAAGCAIVTSDTAPQRRALGDAALLVPPGDAKALAEGLRELAADRGRVGALQEGAYRLADRAFRGSALVGPLRDLLARGVESG